MIDNMPKLSVAIRAYNQASEVLRALDSVVAQKGDFPIEIVLGIDLSTDNTLEVVKNYCQLLPPRFSYRILASETHLGGSCNFIKTLGACIGQFIAICDADDYWIDPEKSIKELSVLETHPEVGLVYANDYIECPQALGGARKEHVHSKPQDNLFSQLLIGNCIGTNVAMFRKELLRYVQFDVLACRKWSQDDYFLWLELANHCEFYHLDDFVSVYTITRNIDSSRLQYDSCEYDVGATQIREYYIKKYPQKTDCTIDGVWDAHYRYQLKSAILLNDYHYAKEAIHKIKKIGGFRNRIYYKILTNSFGWKLYMLYRKRKQKSGLDRYFY